jgi:DNA-binding MarR family transcriptional regulator
VKVTTTTKGHALARKCHDTAVQHDRVLTRGLRPAEVRTLKGALQQLYANVKGER